MRGIACSPRGGFILFMLCTLALSPPVSRAASYLVGDLVWFDTNANGIQDEGEAGVPGVAVGAFDFDTHEQIGETAITDAGGGYRIDVGGGERGPRPFYLSLALPPELACAFTRQDQGDDYRLDSDVDSEGYTGGIRWQDPNIREFFAVDAGLTCDTPLPCSGRIGDYVWFDTNRNGMQDQGEGGIDGVQVLLEDPQGVILERTTHTGGPLNSPGFYLFEGLCAGTYVISINPETVPPDYLPTEIQVPAGTPAHDSDDPAGTVVILPDNHGGNHSLDFGYVSPCTGRIGDYVWFDENLNGRQEDHEEGINGVTLFLEDAFGNVMMQTTSTGGPLDRPGYYAFEGLCAGEYVVSVAPETVPAGYEPTLIGAEDGSPETDTDDPMGTVVLLADDAQGDLSFDFGFVSPCRGQIGDYVWFDADGDGLQDVDEAGIDGVTVALIDGLEVLMTQTTFTGGPLNQPGHYLFEGLCAGTYLVRVDADTVPAGYRPAAVHAPGGTAADDSDNPEGTVVILPDNQVGDVNLDFGYGPVCNDCAGGITELTLRYLGTSEARIEVYAGHSADPAGKLFEGDAGPGSEFTCTGIGANGEMGPEIGLWIDGALHTLIPTSCSQPIGPGLRSGVFEVISGKSLRGGPLCPRAPSGPGCTCAGKVTRLTLRYNGPTEALVTVVQTMDEKIIFEAPVAPQQPFECLGQDADGTLGTEIQVSVDGVLNTRIHTSCSEPIGPGLVRGAFEVLGGDSLGGGRLCPVQPSDRVCTCEGSVKQLTLQYNGPAKAYIFVVQKEDGQIAFEGGVAPGQSFTAAGQDGHGTFGAEILLMVDGDLHTQIHTSCSQSIGPGLVSGDFQVLDGYSLEGGRLCPVDPDSADPGLAEPISDDCGCEGQVTKLTLQYIGSQKAAVTIVQKKDGQAVFDGLIGPGQRFTFSGQDEIGAFGADILIFIESALHSQIHTSCSQPIGPGLVSGDFVVVEGYSLKEGALCPME